MKARTLIGNGPQRIEASGSMCDLARGKNLKINGAEPNYVRV